MKQKWKKIITLLSILLIALPIGSSVYADDDDDHDDEGRRQEYYEEHDGDDDEEEGWETPQINVQQQTEYWNIWSREASNNSSSPLPFTEPGEKVIFVDGKRVAALYLIPQNGQILVSADAIAKMLGAKVTFYPQSKISLLSKDQSELIVKAGSNAAYENKIKTPMPEQALFYEQSIYLPISVAANAFGYRITWDSTQQAMILERVQ